MNEATKLYTAKTVNGKEIEFNLINAIGNKDFPEIDFETLKLKK